jgi:hypothetical protein
MCAAMTFSGPGGAVNSSASRRPAWCSSHAQARTPVDLTAVRAGDSTFIGSARLVLTNNTQVVMQRTYVKADTVRGRRRLPRERSSIFVDAAIPLDSVKSMQREGVDSNDTAVLGFMVLGGLVALVYVLSGITPGM